MKKSISIILALFLIPVIAFAQLNNSGSSFQATLDTLETYYFPQDFIELRLNVKDESGILVTDANLNGLLMQGSNSVQSLYFSYSNLCDCYKSSIWIQENYLGDYIIDITVSKSGYTDKTIIHNFEVEKPVLKLDATTDKATYYGNEEVKFIITATDQHGNSVSPYITGDIRDQTGSLVQIVYPYSEENKYIYNYYINADQVGDTLTLSISGEWKEQTVTDSVSFKIEKRALITEIVLEKTTLKPGDFVRGKIEVTDQTGQKVTDAYIDAQLIDGDGNQVQFFSTTYKSGYYELDERRIEEWFSTGQYTLRIKIEKYPDVIEEERIINVVKDQLDVKIEFDKLTYKPGDRVFLKILVQSPNGEILQDAWLNGEVFPLSSETRDVPGYPSDFNTLEGCRFHLSTESPIFYQGQFIQKYYIDELYIPEFCPISKYVLRLNVENEGYDKVEIEEEFEVSISKLVIESGVSVKSEPDGAQINIYAEIKDDEYGSATLHGVLYSKESNTCIRRLDFYWDSFSNRYSTSQFVSLPECIEGDYILQIDAEHPSYETTSIEQTISVKYNEGFEYRNLVPGDVRAEECQTVSCGPDCFQTICSIPLCKVVLDEACVVNCKSIPSNAGLEVIESCLQSCEIEICGDGRYSSEDEMLRKLNEIQSELRDTRQGVNNIQEILEAIISFLARLFGVGTQEIVPAQQTFPN